MKIYSSEQEENLFLKKVVRTWHRSNLITEHQESLFEKLLPVSFRITNPFFRLVLFGFTSFCVLSSFGLIVWIFEFNSDFSISLTCLLCGTFLIYLGERAIRKYSFYRHGIEEALITCAGFVLAYSVAKLTDSMGAGYRAEVIFALIATSTSFAIIYFRYGFMYSLAISFIGLAAIPFQLSFSPTAERIISMLLILPLFWFHFDRDQSASMAFQKYRDDLIAPGLFLALYFLINLRLYPFHVMPVGTRRAAFKATLGFPDWFYWTTYGLTFILPTLVLFLGIKKRKRFLIDVGLLAAVITLMTNKPYLSKPRYDWDPVLFGLFLIAAAYFVIRFFKRDQNQTRNGYTSRNLLKPDTHGIDPSLLAASLAASPGTDGPSSGEKPIGGGGQSGGGGASGSF